MSAQSAARRVRSRFMRFGFWTSSVAFVVIESDALLDQSEIGHASVLFMFGTACLAAAACIGLFAIISAIGLAVSAAFRDDLPRQQSVHQDAATAVTAAHLGPQPAASLALGRSQSRRHPQRRRARTVTSEARKAPPRAL
jgi:predicted lipid-binding transport protein (Tim44 family)